MNDVVLHAPFAGWLSTLDDVADPVFAGRMMGDGVAIDPTEGVLRAPASGSVLSVPASGHAVTMRLENGAELLLHVGLDTVKLAGRGFRSRVSEGQRVATGDVLIEFDLDAVARAAPDLVTPIVVPADGAQVTMERPGRLVAAGEPIARVRMAGARRAEEEATTARRTIMVAAPDGLHARPAARIVALLRRYDARVTLVLGERSAKADSTVALLALGAKSGDTVEAEASGTDADAALGALASFAAERFGDPVTSAVPIEPVRRAGGVCAAPGLAIGRIGRLRISAPDVRIAGHGVTEETALLDAARHAVAARLERASGAAASVAEAHRALIDDPQLVADAAVALARGDSAGVAWQGAVARAADALAATGDARLAERIADLRDLETQVLLALSGEDAAPAIAIEPDTILVAEDLLPSQFLALDRGRLAGICTAAGGPTAHVAILAAAAGVPMAVAMGEAVLAAPDGAVAILDADAARLDVSPSPEALAKAGERRAQAAAARAAEARAAHDPATTRDGTHVEVFANLGSLDDAAAAVRAGAEGCGLLRTEFLFLDREDAPDEAEQRGLYAGIAATLGDRPLIVRTLDIGGDKPVPYLTQAAEENPALGARGVRLSLARPDLFAVQLRAILAGVPGPQCRIMLPMVADIEELRAARRLLDDANAAVGRTDPVELGVMIETPAAALIAEQLAREADFLSIGTNDLTQYALAADRGNAAVSGLIDALHPAVLRLIRMTADGGAAHGRLVGVCGGLASEPRAAALLVGLGVRELSAVPAAVPGVKAAVRATSLDDARTLAARALDASTAQEVRAMLEPQA